MLLRTCAIFLKRYKATVLWFENIVGNARMNYGLEYFNGIRIAAVDRFIFRGSG